MMEIPLTQGKVALVDDEDFALVAPFKWFAAKDSSGGYYAHRHCYVAGKRTTQSMHNFLMCPAEGKETLHLNGNGLDNRRHSNLRTGTATDNRHGPCRRARNNTSGFRGVDPTPRGFRARVMSFGVRVLIGYFKTAELAARARDNKARELGWPEEGMNFPITKASKQPHHD